MRKKLLILTLSFVGAMSSFSQVGYNKQLLGDTGRVDFRNYPMTISSSDGNLRQQIKDSTALSIDTLTQILKGDTFEVYKSYEYGKMVRWSRYYKGKINAIDNYKDGKAHGNQYTYYKNGKFESQATYRNGALISWIQIYEDGKLKGFRVNDSISGINDSKDYYENGKLSRHQHTNLKTGVTRDIIYNPNGKISSNLLFGAGKQKAVTYNKNGKVVEEYSYIDMNTNNVGECKFYYWDTGKIKEHRFYQDGETRKETNIKTGTWKYWDEDGKLTKEITYDNNKTVSRKHYPSKLEVTIKDTNIVKQKMCTDTIYNCGGYEIGEEYFYIHYRYRRKYQTVVVYFDESMKDTMIYSEFHGYKNHTYKQWNKEGKLIRIHDTKLGVNKAWYPNGNLRWDEVVNSTLSADDYSINVKNKTWYSNGNIMEEYIKVKDTIINVRYYENKEIKMKTFYLYHADETESDGYIYPAKYYHPTFFREEYYCRNGQLERRYNPGYTEKDVKTYYCNGNTKSYIEKYYKQMRLVGKFLLYYETGQIKTKGKFKEYDNGPQNLSVEIGEWIYYDINGNLEKTEVYDNYGELISTSKP